jgi:hypothetical protein
MEGERGSSDAAVGHFLLASVRLWCLGVASQMEQREIATQNHIRKSKVRFPTGGGGVCFFLSK